jgi:hypothetical protein
MEWVPLMFALLAVVFVAAWATHLSWFVKAASKGGTPAVLTVGLLGLLIPIFGIVHGVIIWFGGRIIRVPVEKP